MDTTLSPGTREINTVSGFETGFTAGSDEQNVLLDVWAIPEPETYLALLPFSLFVLLAGGRRWSMIRRRAATRK
jgi:hypothetical protein